LGGGSLSGAHVSPTASSSSSPEPDPIVGQTLGGKYRVVRLLGQGGMGAVYEGEQQLGTTRRRVAIKTLHPHLSRNPQVEARFQREVGTIAELDHPNTIQVHDFGTTPEGILYIVMEFLHGGSLADILTAEGAMTPERTARILEQICGSLEEAHAHGIVHRDLKPDNVVLVERAGQKDFVKVLDFGIAKRAREEDRNEQKLTQEGMVLGTPPYMSPEQFTGQPIDARSDIYSLGVMTYEMLTGKLPFKANTAWEWAAQHMTQPPIPIESLAEGGRVPLPMREALKRALAKLPDQRFQSVREFITAFEAKEAGPAPADAVAHQRTEIASPLDVAAAMGRAPSSPAGLGAPAPTPPPYTPGAGNMAFPTRPVADRPFADAPPHGLSDSPRESSARRGRGALLALAAVIGLVSVVAIAVATRGTRAVVDDRAIPSAVPSSAPATTLVPGPTSDEPAPKPGPTSNGEVPPLKKLTPAPHTASSSASSHADHTEATPPWTPTITVPPLPTVPPIATSTATAPPPTKYDGVECQRARAYRSLGRTKEAQMWSLACIAKGGAP
jgi:serine/threonine-protein kinase